MNEQAERAPAVRVSAHSGASGTWRWFQGFVKRKPLGGIGLVLIFLLTIVAIFGPWLAPRDPVEVNSTQLFLAPQWDTGFYLGTDHLGRDVLSRLIVGARTSLITAVAAVFSGSAVGAVLGLVSGYYTGWVDSLVQRLIDTIMAFPTLVLALAIVAVLGQKTENVIIAIAVLQLPQTARVVRSKVLSVKEAEYVAAARAVGAPDGRILLWHVAPQTLAPIIIVVTAALGFAILVESSLSFLGLGTPPPKPSWGAMLSGPTLQNVERAPWNAVFPGIALTLTVFSFNLLGDALRDILDPRLRR